ncbi:hypothetical protein ColTof4_06409 [Colletotrichum tofieldiae]|nr:hypothetical protein ColTof3_01602 [Colletotrichum tofieldiae]GKT73986.1 hypothetical protein ColTof4_06409 [Colletotrichum tofieldiae]
MAFCAISAIAAPVAQPVDSPADSVGIIKSLSGAVFKRDGPDNQHGDDVQLETRDKKDDNNQDRDRKHRCRRDKDGGRRDCDDDDDDYYGGKGGGRGGRRGGRSGNHGLQDEPNKGDKKDDVLDKRGGGDDWNDHDKGDWGGSGGGYGGKGGGYGDKGGGYGDKGGGYGHDSGFGDCKVGRKCGGGGGDDWKGGRKGGKKGPWRRDEKSENVNDANDHQWDDED